MVSTGAVSAERKELLEENLRQLQRASEALTSAAEDGNNTSRSNSNGNTNSDRNEDHRGDGDGDGDIGSSSVVGLRGNSRSGSIDESVHDVTNSPGTSKLALRRNRTVGNLNPGASST